MMHICVIGSEWIKDKKKRLVEICGGIFFFFFFFFECCRGMSPSSLRTTEPRMYLGFVH